MNEKVNNLILFEIIAALEMSTQNVAAIMKLINIHNTVLIA